MDIMAKHAAPDDRGVRIAKLMNTVTENTYGITDHLPISGV